MTPAALLVELGHAGLAYKERSRYVSFDCPNCDEKGSAYAYHSKLDGRPNDFGDWSCNRCQAEGSLVKPEPSTTAPPLEARPAQPDNTRDFLDGLGRLSDEARAYLELRLPKIDVDDLVARGVVGSPGHARRREARNLAERGYGVMTPLHSLREPARIVSAQVRWSRHGCAVPEHNGKPLKVRSLSGGYGDGGACFGRLDEALAAADNLAKPAPKVDLDTELNKLELPRVAGLAPDARATARRLRHRTGSPLKRWSRVGVCGRYTSKHYELLTHELKRSEQRVCESQACPHCRSERLAELAHVVRSAWPSTLLAGSVSLAELGKLKRDGEKLRFETQLETAKRLRARVSRHTKEARQLGASYVLMTDAERGRLCVLSEDDELVAGALAKTFGELLAVDRDTALLECLAPCYLSLAQRLKRVLEDTPGAVEDDDWLLSRSKSESVVGDGLPLLDYSELRTRARGAGKPTLIIAEGDVDYATVRGAGHDNVVGVPGCGMAVSVVRELGRRSWRGRVVLSLDGDDAGAASFELVREAIERDKLEGLKLVNGRPDNGRDLNDVWVIEGPGAFNELLDGRRPKALGKPGEQAPCVWVHCDNERAGRIAAVTLSRIDIDNLVRLADDGTMGLPPHSTGNLIRGVPRAMGAPFYLALEALLKELGYTERLPWTGGGDSELDGHAESVKRAVEATSQQGVWSGPPMPAGSDSRPIIFHTGDS